jgi:CRP/FNR family transcriptional regulator
VVQIDKRALLEPSPMFSSLDRRQLEELAAIAVPKSYGSGESLFLEGDACEGLFVIARGAVRLIKTVPSGRQIMLAMETAPNSIAEVPVFDGGPYPASVVASGEVEVLLLPRRELLAFCVRNPEVALKMLAVFGGRLRHLVGLLEGVTFGSVRQRLAQMILEAQAQAGEDSFMLPGTHEELAQRLGTVREVVSRNIGRFQAEGFIRVERRKVTILSREGIEREAEMAI